MPDSKDARAARVERLLDEAVLGERERIREKHGAEGVPRWEEPDREELRRRINDTLEALEAGNPNGWAVRPDTTTQTVFGRTYKLVQRNRPDPSFRLTAIMFERRQKEATWNPDDDNDALSPGEQIAMDLLRAEAQEAAARSTAQEAAADLAAAENALTRARAARDAWLRAGKDDDDA